MTPTPEDFNSVLWELQQCRREIAELRRQVGNLPTSWPQGGSSSLPPGGVIYQVLSVLDDAGTKGWEYPRFNNGT